MTTKNQLFKIIPDEKLLSCVLKAFGLENLEDTRLFTKEHMRDINTLDEIKNLEELLKSYYLPCKSKKYIQNITEKKCITILRQILKIFNYKCIAFEKSTKGIKTMHYRLMYNETNTLIKDNKNDKKSYILSFD